MSRMFSYFGLDGEGGKKKKLNPPQMGISLKTDMQMLGLSNPKMFSLFWRIMADCPLSLGDPTGEGGSPSMEQTECGKGQTAGAEARAGSALRAQGHGRSAPTTLDYSFLPLRFCWLEAHLAGSGDGDAGKSQTHACKHPHGQAACGRPACVTRVLPPGAGAHACQPECSTETSREIVMREVATGAFS